MNHQLTSRKLLTVVCEASLERTVVADLGRLGARGYTIIDARGHGVRGDRDGPVSYTHLDVYKRQV